MENPNESEKILKTMLAQHSHKAIAINMGISEGLLSLFLNNERGLKLDQLLKLLDILHLGINEQPNQDDMEYRRLQVKEMARLWDQLIQIKKHGNN